ncbi:Monocarboxylate transporter 2 [Holothuria leucospilota]|uniref:Monocarboxylate transporter 2 n=1 Tax=Holothuria leucospilota TaxID=206669 RepID=A0A9Q1CT37_HOLLE|nr:Monocarboxylate transporter 2 [Holothuria leucospilota]
MDKAIVFLGWSWRVFFVGGCLKSNGVILPDIVEQLGTTNSVVGLAFSLQYGVAYIIGPLTSLLLHIFTRRQVAVFGGCLVGASYIYCGLWLKFVHQLFFAFTVGGSGDSQVCHRLSCFLEYKQIPKKRWVYEVNFVFNFPSGIGNGFHMFAGYLNFCEHFYDNLGTAVSVGALSNFLGMATLPLLFQHLKMSFGLDNGLVLFGVILFNLIVSAFALTTPLRNPPRAKMVKVKQADKEEACPFAKENVVDKYDCVRNEKSRLHLYLQDWCAMFNHENLAVFMALEGLMFYIFVSWGLFLVSVGTSVGLNSDQAVLLSSAGGTGGLFGRLMAVVLFHYKRMNALTSTLFPLLCNSACFMGCAFLRSFYPIFLLAFVSGACIGVNSSGLHGLLPTVVCKFHFHQALATTAFIEGIAMQLAGFMSGKESALEAIAYYISFFWFSRDTAVVHQSEDKSRLPRGASPISSSITT